MALLTSHVLDSVVGTHAEGIQIACFQMDGHIRKPVFDVTANEEGRIKEEIGGDTLLKSLKFELVFQTSSYWAAQPATPPAPQIMDEVVVRFTLPTLNAHVHIPLVLSPHSYSLWWSG